MISFYLNYICKDRISQIRSHSRVRVDMNFEGMLFHPV